MSWSTPLTDADQLLDLLSPTERDRCAAYRRQADRQRFLTGRVLARTVAGEHLGIAPERVELDATCADCGKPHGKPEIPGSQLQLSLTHAGQRVGLASCTGVPLGLDVEAAGRSDIDGLLRYTLAEPELAHVAQLPDTEHEAAFLTYWARKEAVLKATGRGLRIGLQSITMSAPDGPAVVVSSTDRAVDPATTSIVDLDPGDGYRAAVAALTARPLSVTERWWNPT